ncbi:hypothetical protein MASR1M101_07740 [Gemmatimonas sp.]
MLLFASTSLGAQPRQVEFAVGVAAPTGGLGAQRDTGPIARVSISRRDRVARPRGDLDLFTLDAGRAATSARYTGLGASASLLIGRFASRVTPYALAGLGANAVLLSGSGASWAPALRFGAGARYETSERALFVEMNQHIIFSDRGANEYGTAVMRPIVFGASFRLH